MKLHLYKASEANVAVILRQGKQRKEWELIVWDLDTDTFTEGQWLLHKQLDAKTAAISPNGLYFAYGYDTYGYLGAFTSVGVASKLPNFTAEYFCSCTGGRIYYRPHFDKDGKLVMTNSAPYDKRNESTDLETIHWDDQTVIADSGYKGDSFTDPKGRQIKAVDGQLFADDELLYDTTNHVFRMVEPM